jgi:hypothetical protein
VTADAVDRPFAHATGDDRDQVGKGRDPRGDSGATCKTAGFAYTGSNPVPATPLLTCKNGRCAASVAPPGRTRLPSTFPPPDAPPTRPAGHALDQGGRPTRMGEVTRRGEAAQAASGAAPEEAGPTAASGPSWLRVGPRGGCGSVTGSSRLRRTSLRSTSGARGHGVRRRLPRPVGVRMARDPCVQLTGFRLRTRRSDAKLTALPEPGEHSAGSCNSDASISSPRRPLWRGQLQVSSARWRSLANLL